jgi:hypothetical protein
MRGSTPTRPCADGTVPDRRRMGRGVAGLLDGPVVCVRHSAVIMTNIWKINRILPISIRICVLQADDRWLQVRSMDKGPEVCSVNILCAYEWSSLWASAYLIGLKQYFIAPVYWGSYAD